MGGAGGGWGGIRSRERQYLQARGPELGAGRTERRSLSPRRGCPPAPSGEPDGETAEKSHQSANRHAEVEVEVEVLSPHLQGIYC